MKCVCISMGQSSTCGTMELTLCIYGFFRREKSLVCRPVFLCIIVFYKIGEWFPICSRPITGCFSIQSAQWPILPFYLKFFSWFSHEQDPQLLLGQCIWCYDEHASLRRTWNLRQSATVSTVSAYMYYLWGLPLYFVFIFITYCHLKKNIQLLQYYGIKCIVQIECSALSVG